MRISRSLVSDLFKYGFVAVFALIADSGSLALLRYFNINVLLATTIAFLIGTVVNFFLSHGYVFKNPVIKNKTLNFGVYAAIGGVSLVGNDIIVWAFNTKLHTSLIIAKAVSVAVVFFWNFLARRQFLYKGHEVPVTKEISFES